MAALDDLLANLDEELKGTYADEIARLETSVRERLGDDLWQATQACVSLRRRYEPGFLKDWPTGKYDAIVVLTVDGEPWTIRTCAASTNCVYLICTPNHTVRVEQPRLLRSVLLSTIQYERAHPGVKLELVPEPRELSWWERFRSWLPL